MISFVKILRTGVSSTRRLLWLVMIGLVAAALAPGSVLAQGTVTGRVTDASSGEPLVGASVMIQGTERGAVTNARGRYMIQNVPEGERVIEATMLGYRAASRTTDVGAAMTSTVDFALELRPIEIGGIRVSVLRPDLQPQVQLSEREVRESNPKDAGQLLRNLSGVDAVRRGALGLDPVVRGLRETEVGTYLDGTRMFPAGPGRMDSPLTHLDPSAVQAIQVVKGPYALTWGAGNLSAIRVETAPLQTRGEEAMSGSISAGYDSNIEASEVSGSFSDRSGAVSYWAHGAWRQGNDYNPGGSDDVVIPADFSSYEGRAKLGLEVGETSLLTVSGGYQDQGQIDFPGRLMTALFFYASNASVEWRTERPDGLLRNLEVLAYRNRVSHGMDNREKPSATMNDVEVDSDIEVLGGRAAADLVDGPWSIRVGGDVYTADRNAERATTPLMGPDAGNTTTLVIWPDAAITDLGVFGRVSRTFESGVDLAGTVRVDQVWADAVDPSVSFLDFLSRVDGSQDLDATETNLSVALTAGFELGSRWNLSLGLGSAVRTADATERYSDHQPSTKSQFSAEFMGNPNLDPERSNQVDIWLEGRFPSVALQLNAFGRRVSDYITLALTDEEKIRPSPIFPDAVYRYVNGEATFYGSEASLTYALSDVLTADVGASYLWAEETVFPTTDASVEVEEPAIGIAPTTADVGLRYEDVRGRYFLEGTARLVGEQTRVAETRGESASPGYGTFDLRAGLAPLRGINVRLGAENLLDKRYVNHLNSRNPFTGEPVPEPGRVLYVDVSYAF
ncbi:MAG: TonB-dependent receptor domain-containing protein [Gemmatimonadota bacterium]